jgi:hypothetical protein
VHEAYPGSMNQVLGVVVSESTTLQPVGILVQQLFVGVAVAAASSVVRVP